jgi:hypothetical protein
LSTSEYSKDKEQARLGRLCNKLRANYRKNKLKDADIKLLEQIKGWFWKTNDIIKSFDENYDDLKKWLNNNYRMPSRYSKDNHEKKIGQWVERQKTNHRKNKITKEDYKKLENLPYWNVYKKIKK